MVTSVRDNDETKRAFEAGAYEYITNAGGKPMLAIPGAQQHEWGASWSPDGSSLASLASRDRLELAVVRIGSQQPPIYFKDFVMSWSRDSSTLFMASSEGLTAQLFAVDIKTGKAKRIADLGSDIEFRHHTNFCLSASLLNFLAKADI